LRAHSVAVQVGPDAPILSCSVDYPAPLRIW